MMYMKVEGPVYSDFNLAQQILSFYWPGATATQIEFLEDRSTLVGH